MTARTTGDLCAFTTIDETAYGTTGTTKRSAGVLSTLETPGEETLEYDQACGSRIYANIVKTMESYGWTADFTVITGSNWRQWFTYALGSLNGSISNSLDSFSALFRIASDEWMHSVGCKVDSMSLSADSLGSVIKWNVKAMAKKNTFTTTDMSSSAAARPTAKPMTYSSLWLLDGDPIPVKSWNLTIDNKLVGDPGLDVDGSGLAAGLGSAPSGIVDIKLDLTVTSAGPTFDLLKQAGTADDCGLTLTVDGYNIYLMHAFLKTDYPKREQGIYDETLSFIARYIEVEAVNE